MKITKDKIEAKNGRELKAAVGNLSDELKMLSDEDLDQIAGGTITVMCSSECVYNVLRNRCDCRKNP